MKACRTCGKTKPLKDFYRHPTGRDGHRNECKECRCEKSQRYRRAHPEQIRADTARRRKVLRDHVAAAKNGPCADCGRTYPPCVMDFHHEGRKEFLVSRIASVGGSLERLKREIAKCILLCANCHRLRHQAAA